MITPGPVVITVGFIGYLVGAQAGSAWGGLAGATVAALVRFLPCYLFTVIPAAYFRKHGKRPGIVAFVDGVTAASVPKRGSRSFSEITDMRTAPPERASQSSGVRGRSPGGQSEG